jgi:hypothetical protein
MIIMVVNIHTDDVIMNGLVFRETNCFSMEPFNMGSKVQIHPLDLPGIVFSNAMLRWGNDFRIALPVIRIIIANGEHGEFVEKLLTGGICPLVVMMRQDDASGPFKNIPRPPLIGFVAHIAPELIRFHANLPVEPSRGLRLQAFGEWNVDLVRCFFFSSAITVFLAMPRLRLRSRTPLPFSVCASICSFVPGSQAG